jgi:CHAT domain-containing protein
LKSLPPQISPEPSSDITARARALIDAARDGHDITNLLPDTEQQVLALARAIKVECQNSAQIQPERTTRGAEVLDMLNKKWPGAVLFALSRYAQGMSCIVAGKFTDALPLLTEAHEAFAKLGQVRNSAEPLVSRMVALAMLGRNDEARETGELALRHFIEAGDLRSAGKVELNLGTMLVRLDRHAEAIPYYRGAAVRFARVRDQDYSIMADIGLGRALTWQNEFDQAAFLHQRAKMRAQSRGLKVLQAQAQGSLGRLALIRGEFRTALVELASASHLLRECQAAPQQILEAELSLADAYRSMSLLPEAIEVYLQAAETAAQVKSANDQALISKELAFAYAGLGAAAEATAQFEAARRRFKLAKNVAAVASCDVGLSRLALQRNDAATAERLAQAAVDSLADTHIEIWRLEALALQAEAVLRSGRTELAEAMLRAAIDQASHMPTVQQPCRTLLAELCLRSDRIDEAREHLDQVASSLYSVQQTMPNDELRSAVSTLGRRVNDLQIEASLADGDARQLLQQIEAGRNRALLMGLRESRPDAATANRSGSARLRWAYNQWREAVTTGQIQQAEGFAQQMRGLEAELLEASRRDALLASGADSATHLASQQAMLGRPTGKALDIEAVQAALGVNTALVSYHLNGNQLIACVVSADAVCHEVLPVGDLAEHIPALRFQIESLRFGRNRLQQHSEQLMKRAQAHLQHLYALLWRPIEPYVMGVNRVIIVPHRALHYVPFCALHDGRQWLVERHAISYAHSAQVWAAQHAKPDQASHATPTAPVAMRVYAAGFGAGTMDAVETEVRNIVSTLGGQSWAMTGSEATQAALRQLPAEATALHLACHGQFRADNPAFSSLLLADGPLTLHEVSQMQLPLTLVTLSACETAQSHISPGDEVTSLTRAFILAGAKTVLATQWVIEDNASYALMADFYQHLPTKDDVASALRNAQASRARAGEHPFYWAAFAAWGR